MTDGKHAGVGDCTQCQKTTRSAKDSTLWNVEALQTALDTEAWSVTSDNSWQLLLAVLKRSGFSSSCSDSGSVKQRVPHRHAAEEQGKAACMVLPSRVIIAASSALAVALRECWILHAGGSADESLERVLEVLGFVAWVGKGTENRRVLLHHGILQTLSDTLATIYRRRIDPFVSGEAENEVVVRDIRTYNWQGTLQGGPGLRTDIGVLMGMLLNRILSICVVLFDPDAQFTAYLLTLALPEPLADVNVIDPQDSSECVFRELLRLWQMLDSSPSRTHFSPVVLALAHTMGGILVSRGLDDQQIAQMQVIEVVSKSMSWLDADESYIAWRLILMIVDIQKQKGRPWSDSVQARVESLWRAALVQTSDYIRIDVPMFRTRQTVRKDQSPADVASLKVIYAEDKEFSLDTGFTKRRSLVGIGTRSDDSAVDLLAIAQCVGTDDTAFPDTRLRRMMSTLIAHIASDQSTTPTLPWVVQSSLSTVNQLLVMNLGNPASSALAASQEDPKYAQFVMLAEYVQFLWHLCLLPVKPATLKVVLGNMGAEVWNTILSAVSIDVCLYAAAASQGAHRAAVESTLQRLFSLAGWLVTQSSPTDDPQAFSLLPVSSCKLIFARLLSTISSDLSGGQLNGMPAYFAAQALLLVAWVHHTKFQVLLHETQGVADLLMGFRHACTALGEQRGADDIVSPSIGDLSIVSLPEESAWNLTAPSASGAGAGWVERFACEIALLLQASVVVVVSEGGTDKDSSAMAQRVIWQMHKSSVPTSCLEVLLDASSSTSQVLADTAVGISTEILQWLLVTAFSDHIPSGINADQQQRLNSAHKWSAGLTALLVPNDLSTSSLIDRHAGFLRAYRASLIQAMATLQFSRGRTDVRRIIVGCGALEELLSLAQLAGTLDVAPEGDEDSQFSSISDSRDPTDRKAGGGTALGAMLSECMCLVSLLIHGSPSHIQSFSELNGYGVIHDCIAALVQRPGVARAPIATGILSLMSGLPDPGTCRSWETLVVDHKWIPTLLVVCARLGVNERRLVLRFLARWCESNGRMQCWLSQSSIARQCIESLQHLLSDLSQESPSRERRRQVANAYLKALGHLLVHVLGQAMCAPDLKLVFRTLATGLGDTHTAQLDDDESAEYTLAMRRILSKVLLGSARHEVGGSFFSFDGQPAAIAAPHFNRVSEKGFTFSAWFSPDRIISNGPQHVLVRPMHSAVSSQQSSSPATRQSSMATLPQLDEVEPKPASGTVLCLTAANGDMLVISHSFISQGIEIQATVNGAMHHVRCAEGMISPAHWHSLSVCYAPPKRGWSPFSSSNLYVYLNGAQTYKGSLPFIEPLDYRACYIGGSPAFVAGNRPDAGNLAARHGNELARSFSGRISNIRMFDGQLKTSELELLHHLGPMHTMQFRKPQVSDPEIEASTLRQTPSEHPAASRGSSLSDDLTGLFQSSDLGARLTLCLSAAATNGAVCHDTSPIGVCQAIVRENLQYSNSISALKGQNVVSMTRANAPKAVWETNDGRVRLSEAAQAWKMHGDVLAVTTTTIHQALHALGGLEPTLMLLHHLSWIGPAVPPAREGPLGTDESAFDQRSQDHTPLPSFFLWLRDIIRGDPKHLAGIRALNFVPLVASILQKHLQDPAMHLTIAAFRAMQAFQTAFDEQGGLLPAVYGDTSAFWSQVQHDLILNVSIWRHAEVANQIIYLKEIHKVLCAGRRGDRLGKRSNVAASISGHSNGGSSVGVRWILNVLFNLYPYDSSQHVQQQQSKSNRSTPKPQATQRISVLINEDTDRVSISDSLATSEDALSLHDEDDAEGGLPGFSALPRAETRQLRRILLHTLELFLSASGDQAASRHAPGSIPEPNKVDVSHVVQHLLYTCNRDGEHTREILQLLFRCLADGSASAVHLASRLLAQRGLSMLCHIIECDDDTLAAEAINIIALLSAMSAASKGNASTASRLANSIRGRGSVNIEHEDIARALMLVRTKRALTPALYRALLALALGDHQSLLASINIETTQSGPRRRRHMRNLSSCGDAISVHEHMNVQESFVGSLPARVIAVPNAWYAILELSCAPQTEPSMRVLAATDLRQLLDDEPSNFSSLYLPGAPLLGLLLRIIVLGGFFTDELSSKSHSAEQKPSSQQQPHLADVFVKARDHLGLIPHTALDQHMQNLAHGHISSRKTWVTRRVALLRRTAAGSTCSDTALTVQAETELLTSVEEWSQAAIDLALLVIWDLFERKPDSAQEVHNIVLLLWAYSPTGAVPLALCVIAMVLARAQMELASAAISMHGQPTLSERPVLLQNLARFAVHALDILFGYRQHQEYVAFHHERLKALSSTPASTPPPNVAADRDAVFKSQHSPWDDTPQLARELSKFLMQLDEHRAQLRTPLCDQTLRLVLSGIRSMQLRCVEESLTFLVQLLERHPQLGASPDLPLSDASGFVCSGGCSLAHSALAILGYIHEAFVFSEEQNASGSATPNSTTQDREAIAQQTRESIGVLYMLVFQRLRGYLETHCLALFVSRGAQAQQIDKSASAFMEFVQAPDWLDIYRSRLMPSMRSVEEAEMRGSTQSQDAFAQTLSDQLMASQKREAQMVRSARDVQTAVANLTLPIESEEVQRIKQSMLDGPCWIPGGVRGPWLRLWRKKLRAAAMPRGPWRASSAARRPHRWMLDHTENASRMHRRLVRNQHYEDHHVAASRRDKTGNGKNHRRARNDSSANSFDSEEGVPQLSLSITGIEEPGSQSASNDEDWNLVTPEDLNIISASTSDPGRVLMSVSCERIVLLGGVCGRIELTKSALRFSADRDKDGSVTIKGLDSSTSSNTTVPRAILAELSRDMVWPLTDVLQIHFRRHMLRKSAIEVFFSDRSSVFLNIANKKELLQLVWKLTSLSNANAGLPLSDVRSAPTLLNRLKLTERWQHGELSNFDYLMALNTIAGRSYNDLSQYPVFPWIIRDYTSKWLDLSDPKAYRDLSRPIGALNAQRLKHFVERYESFEDPTGRIQKFHYGTHYSSAASVAYYLLRLEPFASVHVSLQSGKFDHADRQFHSLADAWQSCMTGPGDVKELVPEFYYLPEFLTNQGKLDLGVKQDGTRLDDVVLPPWASTPEEFVRINRQALESEHVSANLHKWVDLIFGYKQRGEEAVKAHNVFYYLTYEGAVNLDAITDPVERASVESQINYFGQTPTQLFTAPHPPRHANLPPPLYSPLTEPSGQVQHFVLQASNHDITFVGSAAKPLVAGSSVPWPTVQPPQPQPQPQKPQLAANNVPALGSNAKRRVHREVITAVDSAGRASVYSLTFFTNSDYKFQLAVEPITEGHCVVPAASPPSQAQHRAHVHRRPTAYTLIPNIPELLVSCAHFDGTVKCSRITSESPSASTTPDTPQQTALVTPMATTDRAASMTNAYAGAVVGAMSRPTKSATKPSRSPPQPLRSPFGSLFGHGNSLSGSSGSEQTSAQAISDPAGLAAPASVFIPLAARLLDAINTATYVYLPGYQTSIAASDDATTVVVGSSTGNVAVLRVEIGPQNGVETATGTASAPLAFAAGLADPMNPELGHTSMAAYASASGTAGQNGRWSLQHILLAHDASVLDVAVSTNHDIVAGASVDGTVAIWALQSGQYLRSLMPCTDPTESDAIPMIPDHQAAAMRVERVLITAAAHILCYSVMASGDMLDPDRVAFTSMEEKGEEKDCGEAALHVYNINGRHVRTRKLTHRLRDMAVTNDGMFGAVVSSDSRVAVFDVHTLGIVRQFELPACGCSVTWSGTTEQQIIVGCEGGVIVVISVDLSYIH